MGLAIVSEEAERDWEDEFVGRSAQRQQAAPPIAFPTEQVIAVLSAIGAVLGARLALLLAGLGAYLLASSATANGGDIAPQIVFGVTVVLPLVWLSATRKI